MEDDDIRYALVTRVGWVERWGIRSWVESNWEGGDSVSSQSVSQSASQSITLPYRYKVKHTVYLSILYTG